MSNNCPNCTRAEADAAALRAAVEAAPHGGELSSFAPGACATLRGLPCDCWKARALAASPAPTTEEP